MLAVILDVCAFIIKTLFIVGALLFTISAIVALLRRERDELPRIRVRKMNERFTELGDMIREHILPRKEFKKYLSEQENKLKKIEPKTPRTYVLDFDGDLTASEVTALRHSITAILAAANPGDEVVLRLESPGGVVNGYGLAASQLLRIKDAQLKLVICVDKMAASGGYMMACLAHQLIAAPFAIIGSIGVVASLPNLHRLLQKHGVDYEEATAGEFKRTVSLLGKISEEGRKKFQEQLEDTHHLFKNFVTEARPHVNIQQVATGEYWFASQALQLQLIDKIQTSDDYLIQKSKISDIYHIHYAEQPSFRDRVVKGATESITTLIQKTFSFWHQARFF